MAAGTPRHGTQNPPKLTFRAPTSGHKSVVFHYIKSDLSAEFLKHNGALTDYVRVNFKYDGPTMAQALRTGVKPKFKDPPEPEENASRTAEKKWEITIFKVENNHLHFEDNNKRCYNLYLQHCTPQMKVKLKFMEGWTG